MKKLITSFALLMISTLSYAQKPNQVCQGKDSLNNNVLLKLFISPVPYRSVPAKIALTVNGKTSEIPGTFTKEEDLLGQRMFASNDDSLRFLTSGRLVIIDNVIISADLNCSKLFFR